MPARDYLSPIVSTIAAASVVVGVNCSTPAAPSCPFVIWYKPSPGATETTHAVFAWNGWKRPGVALTASEGGWLAAEIDAPGDELAYTLSAAGTEFLNPYEPLTTSINGREVSVTRRKACDTPALNVTSVVTTRTSDAYSTSVELQFRPARGGSPLVALTEASGTPVTLTQSGARISAQLKAGKHRLVATALDGAGRTARRDVFVWAEEVPKERADWAIYQVMIDRFRDQNGQALSAPLSMSGWAGGKIAGVTKFITSGALVARGFNAVWLSPVYRNPTGQFLGIDGKPYEGYHGYWPISSSEIDARIGTDADLHELVNEAHSRGIRVILDVVPNHVHVAHPLVQEHSDWFRDPTNCVCGRTCDWATQIENCTFTNYLPDVRWENDAAKIRFTEDTVNWIDRFDLDGIRIDAVPMMPRGASRRIALAARERFQHPGHDLMILGEHFTGPDGYDNLRYDLGPFGLDGSFHFPLMWALRSTIAAKSGSLTLLADSVARGVTAWGSANPTMGLMIGNHDVPRFMSVSNGDGEGDPWTAAAAPTEAGPYERQALALGLTFTLPGVPVVYYGDEIGLPGHADPDARRVMPSDASLNEHQLALQTKVARIGKLRTCSTPLRRGEFRNVATSDEWWIFERVIEGHTALVVVTRAPQSEEHVSVDGPWVDAFSGERFDSNVTIKDPWSLRVLLREGDPCATVQ